MCVFVVSSQWYLYTILNFKKRSTPRTGPIGCQRSETGRATDTVIGGAEKREPQTGMKISN